MGHIFLQPRVTCNYIYPQSSLKGQAQVNTSPVKVRKPLCLQKNIHPQNISLRKTVVNHLASEWPFVFHIKLFCLPGTIIVTNTCAADLVGKKMKQSTSLLYLSSPYSKIDFYFSPIILILYIFRVTTSLLPFSSPVISCFGVISRYLKKNSQNNYS